MTTPLLLEVSIGEGATIALLPTEVPEAVFGELEAHFDEVERRPGLGDEPTDEEVAEWCWVVEYELVLASGAPDDFAVAVADLVVSGVQYCPVGIDWAAIEDEQIGD